MLALLPSSLRAQRACRSLCLAPMRLSINNRAVCFDHCSLVLQTNRPRKRAPPQTYSLAGFASNVRARWAPFVSLVNLTTEQGPSALCFSVATGNHLQGKTSRRRLVLKIVLLRHQDSPRHKSRIGFQEPNTILASPRRERAVIFEHPMTLLPPRFSWLDPNRLCFASPR